MRQLIFVALFLMARAVLAVNTYPVLNPKDFGAVGDGSSHPLSAYYGTLAAAKAVYPHAVSLNDEIDWAAIQAAQNSVPVRTCRMSIPYGVYIVNRPLRFFTEDVIEGNRATIRASSSFAFQNNDTAMLVVENENGPSRYAVSTQYKRIFVRDLILDGANVSGANGMLAALQQPSYLRSVRFRDFPGYGLALATSQNANFKDTMFTGCGRSLVLLSATFCFFDGLNIEQSVSRDVVFDVIADQGGPNGIFFNNFRNVHIEQPGTNQTSFECKYPIGYTTFENVWISAPPNSTGKGFDFQTSYGHTYRMTNVRFYTDSASYVAITDTWRGISLTASALNRYVGDFISPDEATGDWASPFVINTYGGGYIRAGSHPNGIEMDLRARGGNEQTRPLLRWRNQNGNELGSITDDGFVEMREVTAPTNGPANSARIFVRDSNGKSQLCVIFGSGAVQCFAAEP
jgi:hypothetical protein